MKKALVALAIAGFASSAFAAIAGSSHDLTPAGSLGYAGQISACQFCHAPHNVSSAVPGAPLWNRSASTATFTYYSSNTVSTTPANAGTNSQTCLSCHDGVSDMGDTFTGSHGFGGTVTPLTASYAVLGTDLTNDHPISIPYVPSANNFATVAAIQTAGLKLYGATQTVECASCHDPHGNTSVLGGASDGGPGGEAFLRAQADAICTSCHLK